MTNETINFLKLHPPHGVTLQIKLSVNAKNNNFIGYFLDTNNIYTVKIAIHAKPKNHEANDELIKFLAKNLNVPKSCISIIKGLHNSQKLVLLNINQPATIPVLNQTLIKLVENIKI